MAKKKDAGAKLSKLQRSLDELGEKLGSAGEQIRDQVSSGVERAVGWSEFAHAVAPLVEAAPDHTLDASEITRALDDPENTSDATAETRRRRDAFIATHGVESWQQHLENAGTLRVERGPGRTVVTRVTD